MVEIFEGKDMIKKFFDDGFTIDCLSKVTGISEDFIKNCLTEEHIEQEDIHKFSAILNFTSDLYIKDMFHETWFLRERVHTLCEQYSIPEQAIAKYMKLTIEELHIFLQNPSIYPDGYALSVKINHLILMFMMEKVYL